MNPPTPVLIFDSRERWHPVGVEESLRTVGAKVPPDFPAPELVSYGGNRSQDRIDFPADMEQPDLPVIGYRRVRRARGLVLGEHWLWYLYNPKQYVGWGEHEGDWEMILTGSTPSGELVLVALSQHAGGQTRLAWRGVEYGEDGGPLVYVARDSHAHYFTRTRDLEDQADGAGASPAIEWREPGPWFDWSGRWGNSGQPPGSGSPPSPGLQEKSKRPLQWAAALV